MLRDIPKCLSGDLLKILTDMGHSDVIVLADANFPASSNAKRLVLAAGVEIPELLDAILTFFPLDNFIAKPVMLMSNLASEPVPEIWKQYEELILKRDTDRAFSDFRYLDRLQFYAEAQKAYAIVSTGTTARYANIMLQKGVV